MVNATPANTRLGEITNELAARVCTMLVSEVEPAISAVVNSTINSAGSARNPTSISRRAPRLPNAVPISIAASAMNTRANANRQIGRASCRARVCQYVSLSVVAVSLTTKTQVASQSIINQPQQTHPTTKQYTNI